MQCIATITSGFILAEKLLKKNLKNIRQKIATTLLLKDIATKKGGPSSENYAPTRKIRSPVALCPLKDVRFDKKGPLANSFRQKKMSKLWCNSVLDGSTKLFIGLSF